MATKRGRCDDHQPVPWANRPTTQARYGLSGSAQQTLHRGIIAAAEGRCYICGLPGADTVDHIVERADGGSLTDPANLGPIHQDPCHEDKTAAANARRRERRRLAREAAERASL